MQRRTENVYCFITFNLISTLDLCAKIDHFGTQLFTINNSHSDSGYSNIFHLMSVFDYSSDKLVNVPRLVKKKKEKLTKAKRKTIIVTLHLKGI